MKSADLHSAGACLTQESLQRTAMMKIRRSKRGDPRRPEESFISNADTRKTPSHKMAETKAAPPPAAQSGANRGRCTVSAIVQLGHPTRRNE